MNNEQRLTVNTTEAAELLGVCPQTLRKLLHTPGFPAVRQGKRWIISRLGLERWLLNLGQSHSA